MVVWRIGIMLRFKAYRGTSRIVYSLFTTYFAIKKVADIKLDTWLICKYVHYDAAVRIIYRRDCRAIVVEHHVVVNAFAVT